MAGRGGANVIELEFHDPTKRMDAACRAGARIAKRLSADGGTVRSCPIRREFFCRPTPNAIPSIVKMLRGGIGGRGGQGGEVRLKLYLSVLWFASGDGHAVEWPASHWADLLGLPERDTKGKRRIQQAFAWLNENHFVEVTQRPGKHPTITLLHEGGTGAAYTKPGPEAEKGGEPTYRQLSPTWWTNGWIARLSGAAIITWLVYQDESGTRSDFVWLTPDQSKQRYALSTDSRKKGLSELRSLGLIELKRVRHSEAFDSERSITKYRLVANRLAGAAPVDIS